MWKANPYQHTECHNSLRFIKYLSQELIRNIVCTFEMIGDKRKIEANWKLSLIAISKYIFYHAHKYCFTRWNNYYFSAEIEIELTNGTSNNFAKIKLIK